MWAASSVGSRNMPAGTYTIRSVSQSAIAIMDRDTGKCVLSLIRPEWAGKSNGTPKLVFHKYENEYFLFQVSRGLGSSVMQLPTSKLERELRIASTRGTPEQQTIVASK